MYIFKHIIATSLSTCNAMEAKTASCYLDGLGQECGIPDFKDNIRGLSGQIPIYQGKIDLFQCAITCNLTTTMLIT